nr:MAG TPA: hypothetical protein [Caudoviricetes sp.]
MKKDLHATQKENYIQMIRSKYYEKYRSYPDINDIKLLILMKRI